MHIIYLNAHYLCSGLADFFPQTCMILKSGHGNEPSSFCDLDLSHIKKLIDLGK